MMCEREFVTEVLGWKYNDIVDEKLLHSRMTPIPKIFGDARGDWHQTFPPFVLEEFREQLQRIIEKDEFGSFQCIDQFIISSSVLQFPPETRYSSIVRDKGMFSLALVAKLPHKNRALSINDLARSSTEHYLLSIGGEIGWKGSGRYSVS
jgi:hypothetical protein